MRAARSAGELRPGPAVRVLPRAPEGPRPGSGPPRGCRVPGGGVPLLPLGRRYFYPSGRILGSVAGGGDGPRITKEILVTPSDLSELIVSLGGVKFWVVAMAPLFIGWVLAQPVGGRHLFVDDIRPALSFLVIGPFLSTFTLLFNTYYDMGTTDRANPRKKYVRMVEEVVDRETLLWASLGFAALGLLLAAYVSGNFVGYAGQDASGPVTRVVGPHGFTLLMLLVAALSVAYSHPRIRWKGVAGVGLVAQMVGFGGVFPLRGGGGTRPRTAPWARWGPSSPSKSCSTACSSAARAWGTSGPSSCSSRSPRAWA